MRGALRRSSPCSPLTRRTTGALLWAAASCGGGGGGSDGTDGTGAAPTTGAPTTGGEGGTSSGPGPTSSDPSGASDPTGGDPTGSSDPSGPAETSGDGTTGDGTTGAAGCAPGRVEFDRPDDQEDAYQIHVSYVLPSDGVDEQFDLDGRIATSVASFRQWFAAQADGRKLRVDTCDGALDIRFVRLAQTEAALKAEGVYIRDALEAEMQGAGLLAPNKLELVYYGGDADSTCGSGPFPPGLIGRVGALYLKGTFADPNIPACASNPVGASLEQPGYFDFSALHEMLHALGLAPACAPHHVPNGHVGDSPTDLMYAGAQPWTPAVLDLGRDDYLDHGVAGCPDLGRSVFLEPLPADPQLPPGW